MARFARFRCFWLWVSVWVAKLLDRTLGRRRYSAHSKSHACRRQSTRASCFSLHDARQMRRRSPTRNVQLSAPTRGAGCSLLACLPSLYESSPAAAQEKLGYLSIFRDPRETRGDSSHNHQGQSSSGDLLCIARRSRVAAVSVSDKDSDK